MSKHLRLSLIAAAFALFWLLTNTLYTVSETQQALIVRLGAPIGAVSTPGLKFKMPLIDTVIYYDTRLLTLQPDAEQVILGDQKRLEVQPYAQYRIADPLRFYQAFRNIEQATPQLSQLLSSSMRRELGQIALPVLLSPQRPKVIDQIEQEVIAKVKPMGVEIAEVRLHRADLPLETSQAIYDRMKSERQREARELRARGSEWAQQIQADADRQRVVIVSEAQRQAKITHGEADAEANRIMAEAIGSDPQFYKLYRSLQTYRQALADSAPTLILSPDTDFLRNLKNGPGGSAKH